MKRFAWILWIAGFWALVFSCSQRKMTRFEIDYLVLEADRLIALEDLDSAATLINDMALHNPRDTMLLLRQGLINRQLESVEGRRKSETALRRLVQMHPRNPQYHLELAKTLIAQTFEMEGRGELARTIAIDPENEEPYLILADLYRRPYFVNDFVDRGDSAVEILNALLKRKPLSLSGLTKLAEVHAVAGRIDSAEIFATRAFASDSTTPGANLVLGYAHFRKRRFEAAAEHFGRALTVMDSSARAGYKSLEYLIAPQNAGLLRKLTPEQRDTLSAHFWFKEDTDPTTEVNERQVEHFARVWMANLLFTDRRYDLEGWKTDMGETLIRLGPPDDRRRRHLPGDVSTSSPTWLWFYTTTNYPCTLGFVDHTLSGVFRFPFPHHDVFADSRIAESKQISHLIYRARPSERWQDRELTIVDIEMSALQFRGIEGKTRVELLVRAECDSFLKDGGKRWPGGEIRASLRTSGGQAAWSATTSDQGHEIIRNKDGYATLFGGEALPGQYRIGAAVDQTESGRFGARADTLGVRDFGGKKVAMSDIVLAQDEQREPVGLMLRRGKEPLILSLNREYGERDTIIVYFEIYNLALDLSGRTRYQVSYAVQFVKESRGGLKGFVGKLFPGRRESITNSYREGGTTAEVERRLALSAGELRPGYYRLSVTVQDLVMGGTVEQSTDLTLID